MISFDSQCTHTGTHKSVVQFSMLLCAVDMQNNNNNNYDKILKNMEKNIK